MTKYDASSPESILGFSKGLINKSLLEAVVAINPDITKDDLKIGGKGSLGQMVEKFYYGYDLNNSPSADFAIAGVELKTTPLKQLEEKNKKTQYAIKERLVCDMIDFCAIVNVRFEDSPFYKKSLLMLILFYLHQKGVEKCDLKFIYSVLWKLQGKDLQMIKHDYEVIVEKIRQGKAHELSEGDTMYLGACRKGQKGDPLRKQPFNEIDAPKRAFALKMSYMRTILEYVESSGYAITTNTEFKVPDVQLVSDSDLAKKSFEEIIVDRLMAHKGQDYKQIANSLDIIINSSEKSKYDHATKSILHKGLKSFESAEEFKKAGIVAKSIRIEKSGRIKESLAFKNVSYQEVFETESFFKSEWYELITSKFMFVIYREVEPEKEESWSSEKRYVLDNVFFWTMPESDLQIAEEYWLNIKENVAKDCYYLETGNTYWKMADHRCFHIRPKAANSSDMQTSPISGKKVPKICYWFNNDYVQKLVQCGYGSDWQNIFNKTKHKIR